MSKFMKINLILSLMISLSLANSEKEILKKNEQLSNNGKKIETPEEVLKRLQKDGEKESNIDKILNGNTGFKLENKEENGNSTKSKSNNIKKIETPEEVLKRLQKDGEKESNIDKILNGNTGFKK
ncbi:conserved hypothetical protein [Aliarcobacter butzleri JV22]|uniref:hypothetical protein n=1 Tax=Aliarcobacter butzleri TaxID=28197 RepID=UPI0001F16309|nr:hypothetical protein [Aliarcobacter butzleri]EFU68999.1 conserved hypothetical protein [Aliarcobacter butzleri JV22]